MASKLLKIFSSSDSDASNRKRSKRYWNSIKRLICTSCLKFKFGRSSKEPEEEKPSCSLGSMLSMEPQRKNWLSGFDPGRLSPRIDISVESVSYHAKNCIEAISPGFYLSADGVHRRAVTTPRSRSPTINISSESVSPWDVRSPRARSPALNLSREAASFGGINIPRALSPTVFLSTEGGTYQAGKSPTSSASNLSPQSVFSRYASTSTSKIPTDELSTENLFLQGATSIFNKTMSGLKKVASIARIMSPEEEDIDINIYFEEYEKTMMTKKQEEGEK